MQALLYPSLKADLDEICCNAYSDAVLIAARETGLLEAVFPEANSFSWEQMIDDYWPEFPAPLFQS